MRARVKAGGRGGKVLAKIRAAEADGTCGIISEKKLPAHGIMSITTGRDLSPLPRHE